MVGLWWRDLWRAREWRGVLGRGNDASREIYLAWPDLSGCWWSGCGGNIFLSDSFPLFSFPIIFGVGAWHESHVLYTVFRRQESFKAMREYSSIWSPGPSQDGPPINKGQGLCVFEKQKRVMGEGKLYEVRPVKYFHHLSPIDSLGSGNLFVRPPLL